MKDVEIHVFEASARVGGRTKVQHIDGEYFESGASIAVEANPYLIEMSEYAELARVSQVA